VHVLPRRDADLEAFLKSLAHAWQDGEIRPTHRSGPKPARHWRTRADPFERVWPRVVTWLELEPDRTAKELFARLCSEPGAGFAEGQLRTLQRKVKDWRYLAARRLLFVPSSALPSVSIQIRAWAVTHRPWRFSRMALVARPRLVGASYAGALPRPSWGPVRNAWGGRVTSPPEAARQF